MRPVLVLVAILVAAKPGIVKAQNAGSFPRVLDLPASTRAMALGDAYLMNSGQSDVIFYHPSLLIGAEGFALELQRWGSESSSVAASAATQWFGNGIGIGILTLQYGAPGTGVEAAPEGQDHLFQAASVPVSERVALLSLARELFGVGLGVSGKLVEERINGDRDSAVQVDLSASREIGPLTFGVTLQHWGEEPFEETGGADPTRVLLGAGAYGEQLGPLDYGVTTAAAVDDERVVFSGGFEVGYWPLSGRTFVARVGLRDIPDASQANPLSVGFAFWGDDLLLEWAFQPMDGAAEGGTHRFGIGWR